MSDLENRILSAFGHYKTDWFGQEMFQLFRKPRYFGALETATPVMLEGGRGTGKTTVLRSMEYKGQFAISEGSQDLGQIPYWGVYYKVDTSRVRAFTGGDLSEDEWTRVFSHYFNLIICQELCELALWVSQIGERALPEIETASIAKVLGLKSTKATWNEIGTAVVSAVEALELYVNNLRSESRPLISMARAPVEYLVSELARVPALQGRRFFVLLDEFENLLDYQQRVVNTYVKHCGPLLSYKIGVRPSGRRDRRTLNDFEILESPADFELVDIDKRIANDFPEFAESVCEGRLQLALASSGSVRSLQELLPGLTIDEEVLALGGDEIVREVREQLDDTARGSDEISPSDCVLLKFESVRSGRPLAAVNNERRGDPKRWRERRSNYSSALLFFINAGRRGGVRRKFYCGARTLGELAHNNIRFYLLLVSRCIVEQLSAGRDAAGPIDPSVQTAAAREVGLQFLSELEAMSEIGGQLKRLVLALGRIYQVLAHNPVGHTVEVTSFSVAEGPIEEMMKAGKLLREACSRLAVIRFPSTKPTESGSTRDDEFMLHPIFSPFFEISPRQKRKLILAPEQVLGLIESPRETIEVILGARDLAGDRELPSQLAMFESFLSS